MNNEIKVGSIVVITIALLIFGLNYLRGRGLFSNETLYFTYYENAGGLQASASVQLNGVMIGKVTKVELEPDLKVKVTIGLNNNIKVPTASTAQLIAADLISGTKAINLIFSNQSTYLEPNSIIIGSDAGGLLDNLSSDISPIMSVLHHTIGTLDSVLISVNNVINDDAKLHINSALSNLDVTLKNLGELTKNLQHQTASLGKVMDNANAITGNLAESNAQITQILTNTERATQQFAEAPVQKTFEDLQQASNSLQMALGQFNDTTGSVGKLLYDNKLYNNLSGSLEELQSVLDDIKKHPSKYINVSVFGRKSE